MLLSAALAACGGGGGGAEPQPTASPSPSPLAQTLSVVAGNRQTAAPGTAVALAPQVLLKDETGAPVVGARVRFAVTSGGGSVSVAESLTDAAGHAAAGAWTLGSAKGPNTLSASVDGVAPVTFTATAAVVSSDVTVTLLAPGSGITVGEAVTVEAQVASTYQMRSVTAAVDGASVALVAGSSGTSGAVVWQAVLPLGSRPRGPMVLVVTASDVFGNATDAVVPLTLDRAPVVGAAAPLEGSVARPVIELSLTCSDDDSAGCTALRVLVEDKPLLSGKDTLTGPLDLSAYEGRLVALQLVGVDSAGQKTQVTRKVYVESSPRLAVRAEITGNPWDADAGHVLFLDPDGALPALKLLTLANGRTETVEATADFYSTWGNYGYLTPGGAVYVRGRIDASVFPYAWLFEWQGGTPVNLAGLNSSSSLRVKGPWAIYNRQPDSGSGYELWRRDLAAKQSTLIASNAGNIFNDVAANGDAAWWTSPGDYNARRWRDGTTLALTADVTPVAWNVYTVTDGSNVVYRKSPGTCCSGPFRIAMHDGTKETILAPAMGFEPAPGTGYAAAGGYVAYVAEDGAKTRQVWRHSPAGEEQISFFGTSSEISAIAPDGTVVFVNGPRRWRAVPGQALQDVGSANGRVIERDGRLYLLLGRAVLDLLP